MTRISSEEGAAAFINEIISIIQSTPESNRPADSTTDLYRTTKINIIRPVGPYTEARCQTLKEEYPLEDTYEVRRVSQFQTLFVVCLMYVHLLNGNFVADVLGHSTF